MLEALVALVLLSSVGFALLAWVHQNLDATHRLREFYAEQETRRAALDWLKSLNPMENPEGEFRYKETLIRWKNIPVSEPIPQAGYPQGIGKHEVALFKTEVQAFRPYDAATPWFTEEITSIGYRRAGVRATTFN